MEGQPSTLPQSQNPKPSDPQRVASPAATVTATAAAAVGAPESKKRRLEDGEFRNSKYFKIRAIVKDLRPLFIEVLRASDFRNSKSAVDIQKQMKIMIELSKELRSEEEPPLSGGTKDGNMGKHQEGGARASHTRTGEISGKHQVGDAHASHPQTGAIPSAPTGVKEKMLQHEKTANTTEKEPLSSRVRSGLNVNPARAQEENIRGAKEYNPKQFEEGNGTYVVGGSPIGWNFLLYPSGEPVYYGVTKASAVLRRAAK